VRPTNRARRRGARHHPTDRRKLAATSYNAMSLDRKHEPRLGNQARQPADSQRKSALRQRVRHYMSTRAWSIHVVLEVWSRPFGGDIPRMILFDPRLPEPLARDADPS